MASASDAFQVRPESDQLASARKPSLRLLPLLLKITCGSGQQTVNLLVCSQWKLWTVGPSFQTKSSAMDGSGGPSVHNTNVTLPQNSFDAAQRQLGCLRGCGWQC